MAKIIKNAIGLSLSGKVGDLVFRQMPDGSTRVSRMPDFSQRVFSQGQKDHQKRFKQAATYAGEAAKTLPIYTELARGSTKNAYNWALSDWFNPPVIKDIQRKGGTIRVHASDAVMVTEVYVKILDKDGNVLDEGQAIQTDSENEPERWEYQSDTQGRMEAIARDLAGNETRAVM